MSNASILVEATVIRRTLFSFLETLTTLDFLSVTFRRDGNALALRGASVLTSELQQAISEHKPSLLILCDCRAELGRLHEYIIRLRCEDPPKGRAYALRYLAQQIEKLAAMSMEVGGTADGWFDFADVFADNDQIAALRSALAEIEAGPYPMPLPDGCVLLPQANFDPFEHGLLYNGMRLG